MTPMQTHPSAVTGTVTIEHPDVASLTDAVRLYQDVHRGEWATLAQVCEAYLHSPQDAARDLTSLASRTGWVFPGCALETTLDPDAETLTLPARDAAAVLDLFSRVLCGQWSELAWVTALAAVTVPGTRFTEEPVGGLPLGDALSLARVRWQRPDGLWPQHPRASVGIAQGPAAARLAYHAYKELGVGAPGRPTFALDVPVRVTRND